MPLTCCSIGAATVSATTWALAPGYWIDTCTPGGVICGYCAIGKVKSAIATRQGNGDGQHGREDRPIDEEAREHVSVSWWSIPNDGIVVCSVFTCMFGRNCWIAPTTTQSSAFSPLLITRRPSRWSGPGDDLAVFGLVRRIDDVNVLLPLIRLNGPIDDEQGRVRWADRQPNPDEHAGRHQANAVGRLGVGEHAAHGDAAGVGIELVIGKVDKTLVRIRLSPGIPRRTGISRLDRHGQDRQPKRVTVDGRTAAAGRSSRPCAARSFS